MTCADAETRDLLADYASGQLTGAARDALEAHLIECGDCARALEALLTARDELAAAETPPVRAIQWRRVLLPSLAAAAALIVFVVATRRAAHAPDPQTRAPAAASASAGSAGRRGTDPELVELARVAPPAYAPFTVRSGDERAARFDTAMNAYTAGDFARARDALQHVVGEDAGNLPARFYLGVCLMMTDDAGAAANEFRAVSAAGPSPFHASALVLLAKALMRTGDLAGAHRELQAASHEAGPRAREAADLLPRLEALQRAGAR
jgi:TolA-binding protein